MMVGKMSEALKPWKWAVREVGGGGMWAGANSEEEANANCEAWRADGFDAEVVALYDQLAVDELRDLRAWRDKAFQVRTNLDRDIEALGDGPNVEVKAALSGVAP